MTGINCEVIEDLLPLYVEDMASQTSCELVKEHLESCPACREKEMSMRKGVELPKQGDVGVLKKISDTFYHKRVMTSVMTMCIVLVLGILVISHLHAPIRLSYEQVAENIRIQTTEDGKLELWVNYPDSETKIQYSIGEDGINYAQITCYTSKWLQLFGGENYFYGQTILLENPGREGNGTPGKLYYSPKASGESVCIYRAEDVVERPHDNYIELPRLVLNVYRLFAEILGVVGIVVCTLLRKKKKALYIAERITVVPVMYVLSSMLILFNVGDVYNAGYYFSGILLVTVLLSLVCWWGIGLRARKRMG